MSVPLHLLLKFNIGRDFTKKEVDYILENEVVQPPYFIDTGNQGIVSKRIHDNPNMAHLKYIADQALQKCCDSIFMLPFMVKSSSQRLHSLS